MTSTISLFFHLFTCLIATVLCLNSLAPCDGFALVPSNNSQATFVWMASTTSARSWSVVQKMAEEDKEDAVTAAEATIVESSVSETLEKEVAATTNAVDVKCPDCDLCDGSGRIPGCIGAGKLADLVSCSLLS